MTVNYKLIVQARRVLECSTTAHTRNNAELIVLAFLNELKHWHGQMEVDDTDPNGSGGPDYVMNDRLI